MVRGGHCRYCAAPGQADTDRHGGRHQHAQRHRVATKFGHFSSLAKIKKQPPAMPTLLSTAASRGSCAPLAEAARVAQWKQGVSAEQSHRLALHAPSEARW